METIATWYAGLDFGMRMYWGIAVFSSTIFLVQMIMTFIGIGDADGALDGDFDLDANAHGDTLDVGGTLQLFSVRNIVNFLLGAGWGGVCLASSISSPVWLAVASLLTGVAFVVVFALVYRQMRRLEHDGTFDIQDCVGQVADVYLRIPHNCTGQGKIQYSFQGSVQELPAVTKGEAIPSGAKVRVLGIIDNHTILVEKL